MEVVNVYVIIEKQKENQEWFIMRVKLESAYSGETIRNKDSFQFLKKYDFRKETIQAINSYLRGFSYYYFPNSILRKTPGSTDFEKIR